MGTDTRFRAIDAVKAALHLFQAAFRAGDQSPIDPIREELVMSLVSFIGRVQTSRHEAMPRRTAGSPPADSHQWRLEKIRSIAHFEEAFDTKTLNITYPSERGAKAWTKRLRSFARGPNTRSIAASISSFCPTE